MKPWMFQGGTSQNNYTDAKRLNFTSTSIKDVDYRIVAVGDNYGNVGIDFERINKEYK